MFDESVDLLFIHRNFFAQAIINEPLNPLKHKYGPSVMASYRSAYKIMSGLRDLHAIHPKPTSKLDYHWAVMFSACVIIAGLIIKSPGSSLSWEAFPGLQCAIQFFETVRSNEPSSQSATVNLASNMKRLYILIRTNRTCFEHCSKGPRTCLLLSISMSLKQQTAMS